MRLREGKHLATVSQQGNGTAGPGSQASCTSSLLFVSYLLCRLRQRTEVRKEGRERMILGTRLLPGTVLSPALT